MLGVRRSRKIVGAWWLWGASLEGEPLPLVLMFTLESLTLLFLLTKAISAGKDHTCAIDIDQKAWCFGNFEKGKTSVPGNEALVDTGRRRRRDRRISQPGATAYRWVVSALSQ